MSENVGGSDSLEGAITDKFIDELDSDDTVSDAVQAVISELSSSPEFGGRKRIAELVLKAVSDDED